MLALAHGTNDAQKTMGVITLALIANGNLPEAGFEVPTWVIVTSATAIALGTYTGGWRIIRTMGTRIINMDTAQGFSAQGAGAATILASSHFGFPLSTTQVIAGGVMGAGAGKRLSAVRWGVAGNLVIAWLLTLPAAAAIGAAALRLHQHLRRRRGRAAARLGAGNRARAGALRPADQARTAGAGGVMGVGDLISLATVIDGKALWETAVGLPGRRRRDHDRGLDRDLRVRHLRRRPARRHRYASAALAAVVSLVASLAFVAGDRLRPDRHGQRLSRVRGSRSGGRSVTMGRRC